MNISNVQLTHASIQLKIASNIYERSVGVNLHIGRSPYYSRTKPYFCEDFYWFITKLITEGNQTHLLFLMTPFGLKIWPKEFPYAIPYIIFIFIKITQWILRHIWWIHAWIFRFTRNRLSLCWVIWILIWAPSVRQNSYRMQQPH